MKIKLILTVMFTIAFAFFHCLACVIKKDVTSKLSSAVKSIFTELDLCSELPLLL